MTSFYHGYLVDKINKEVSENELFVAKIYKELFKKPYHLDSLTDKELNELIKKIQYEKNIINSPFTLEEVNQILLFSEISNGGSLQAFTDYVCDSCNKIESWHNSNVPSTCNECRNQKAMKIIQSNVFHRIAKQRKNKV